MTSNTFVFENYSYEPTTHQLSLRYHYVDGPSFEEIILFDGAHRALTPSESEALDRIFRLLFLLCGVSYYKSFVPPNIVCAAFPLDLPTAAFVQEVYRKGLAEFAFTNGLRLDARIVFPYEAQSSRPQIPLTLPRMTCVPVGGGKDSIVTVECLKRAGEPLVLFSLGKSDPIDNTISTAALPFFRVRRFIDAALFALNDEGALNGHVPITAILSVIAIASAIIYGFDVVAMSNESSASSPNVIVGGVEVNHQYSKSLEFERLLADHIDTHIAQGIAYFSFLRPLTETAIARAFARNSEYHSTFRSCNRAYRLDIDRRERGWCCDCPKCRFVFLALAPFLSRDRMTSIFGRNLLAIPEQTGGFAELCGIGGHKPFECVGEESESRALILQLATTDGWKNDDVVLKLSARMAADGYTAPPFLTLFDLRPAHRVPSKYLEILDACR